MYRALADVIGSGRVGYIQDERQWVRTFDVVDVMKLLIFLSSFITSLVPILYFCVMGILRRNITRMESLLYKEV